MERMVNDFKLVLDNMKKYTQNKHTYKDEYVISLSYM